MAIMRRHEPEHEHQLARRREWDPFERLLTWDPFEEMRRILAPPEMGFVPSFDVKETKDAYVFKADLPGIEEKDLELTLTGNRLTVSGKREEERKEEEGQYYTYERKYGSFTRSFTLPEGVDLEGLTADLENGELSIRVPKKPELISKKIPLLKNKPGVHA
jgi:HSP20 family protein